MPCPTRGIKKRLVESRWPCRGEDLGLVGFRYTVRKRELEVLGEELLDVWSADLIGVGDFDDLEDLEGCQSAAWIIARP